MKRLACSEEANRHPARLEPNAPHPLQCAAYRRMTPNQRGAMAAAMIDDMLAAQEAAIRSFYPGWSDEEVRTELKRRRRRGPR